MYTHVYRLFILLCDCWYLQSWVVVYRILSWSSHLTLTALRRFPKMSTWKTVGMLAPSCCLPATFVQNMEEPQRIQLTDTALMTSISTWSSSAPLRN